MWPVLETEKYLTHRNCGFSHEIMGALNGDSILIHVGRGIISCKSNCQHISRVEIIVWELSRMLHMTNVVVGSIGRRCRGLSFDILLADPVSLHIWPKTTLPVPYIHIYMHCSAWVDCNRSDCGCVLLPPFSILFFTSFRVIHHTRNSMGSQSKNNFGSTLTYCLYH